MKKNRIFHGRKIGFTLTEILIVVVIVGLVGTLALPVLVKTIEKAKVGEAISNLNLIHTGEKIYFLQYGFYAGKDVLDHYPGEVAITKWLNIEDPNIASGYFDYTLSDKDANTDFVATAKRKSGAPNSYEYYISEPGDITSNGPLYK